MCLRNIFKKLYHYGKNVCVSSEWGVIDFSPVAWKKVVGGEKLSYDEYLEVMRNSSAECRHYFQKCYYELPMNFKGQIEKKNNKNICFKRIDTYEVPSDDELLSQGIDEMICETCFYYDKCNYTYCFLRKK